VLYRIVFAFNFFIVDSFKNFCLSTLEELLAVGTVCEIASLLEELSETPLAVLTNVLAEKCDTYPINA
jgi:hypothetical protein